MTQKKDTATTHTTTHRAATRAVPPHNATSFLFIDALTTGLKKCFEPGAKYSCCGAWLQYTILK